MMQLADTIIVMNSSSVQKMEIFLFCTAFLTFLTRTRKGDAVRA